MSQDTPGTPPPLPSSGGSYERQDDGSLKHKPDDAAPVKPAAKPKNKEA
jgi:hypothetical protein